jgi:hypothetical protein
LHGLPEDFFTDPENRIALLLPSAVMAGQLKVFRSGVSLIFIAHENIATRRHGFIMDAPLKEIISLKASQFQEAGIIQLFVKSALNTNVELKPEEIGPQVLTLRHLAAGFIVILFLLVLSIAVFAFEFATELFRLLSTRMSRPRSIPSSSLPWSGTDICMGSLRPFPTSLKTSFQK